MEPTAKKKQPKGFVYIAILMACEFFSYYGIRFLLVLFFTQTLLFTDSHAYALYGSFTSLVWLTPIVGGYIADRFLGYYNCVITGTIMIFAGNLLLAFSGKAILLIYFAMGIIICGYGFFKGNVSCLAGTLYRMDDPRRQSGFSWLYVCANIGSFLAAIICGIATYQSHNMHMGFLVASSALFVGNICFIFGIRHFPALDAQKKNFLNGVSLLFKNRYWFICGTIVAVLLFTLLLLWNDAIYLLTATGIIAFGYVCYIFNKCNSADRKNLLLIMLFMLFSIIFWIINQQTGSSVPLFINRNIDKHLLGIPIPTISFQVANSIGVIAGGVAASWLWRTLKKAGIALPSIIKLSIASLLLAVGFALILLAASEASNSLDGKAHMMLAFTGILFAGIAELFVDPVIIANITRLDPGRSSGVLIGIYFLVTGSIANYISGNVARLSDVPFYHDGMTGGALAEVAKVYTHFFSGITLSGLGLTVLLIVLGFVIHRLIGVKEE